ncbi:ABC transporter ATP-binding protein [Enterococcus sp. LJL128]
MSKSTISIAVSSLKKSYQGKEVLKDVNFSVPSGTIYALLGSNGAGKTTIVKILSTLLKPDGGNATINDFDIESQSDEVRECISLTGQFVAVDEVLTGRENLKLIGQLRRLPDVKSKTNEWLSFFYLEDAANRKVSTYSGGMRRRLDIAMSLMDNPQVLFLDEPTTGLDPQNRIAMWELVKSLAKKGTTVFLTTQYLEEAEYLADHVAILHKGKILVEGTPQYLKEILPKRGVSLNFNSEESAIKAIELLRENDISADTVEQNLPSLEDVFLTLIDEKKEDTSHAS